MNIFIQDDIQTTIVPNHVELSQIKSTWNTYHNVQTYSQAMIFQRFV